MKCQHCEVTFLTRAEAPGVNPYALFIEHVQTRHPQQLFKCGRRDTGTHFNYPNEALDCYRADDTCSYCGSLSPTKFFELVEAGAELGPTDKSYKVYLRGLQGASIGKFYFQHLDEVGKDRFIQLYNARQLKLGVPGHFYVLPYFMRLVDKEPK